MTDIWINRLADKRRQPVYSWISRIYIYIPYLEGAKQLIWNGAILSCVKCSFCGSSTAENSSENIISLFSLWPCHHLASLAVTKVSQLPGSCKMWKFLENLKCYKSCNYTVSSWAVSLASGSWNIIHFFMLLFSLCYDKKSLCLVNSCPLLLSPPPSNPHLLFKGKLDELSELVTKVERSWRVSDVMLPEITSLCDTVVNVQSRCTKTFGDPNAEHRPDKEETLQENS